MYENYDISCFIESDKVTTIARKMLEIKIKSVAPESEGSSPCLQKPAIGPYLEPTGSIPQFPANLHKIHSDLIYALVFRVVSFFQASPSKSYTLFSPLACEPHAPPTLLSLI
jgi:hypothetical protein